MAVVGSPSEPHPDHPVLFDPNPELRKSFFSSSSCSDFSRHSLLEKASQVHLSDPGVSTTVLSATGATGLSFGKTPTLGSAGA